MNWAHRKGGSPFLGANWKDGTLHKNDFGNTYIEFIFLAFFKATCRNCLLEKCALCAIILLFLFTLNMNHSKIVYSCSCNLNLPCPSTMAVLYLSGKVACVAVSRHVSSCLEMPRIFFPDWFHLVYVFLDVSWHLLPYSAPEENINN